MSVDHLPSGCRSRRLLSVAKRKHLANASRHCFQCSFESSSGARGQSYWCSVCGGLSPCHICGRILRPVISVMSASVITCSFFLQWLSFLSVSPLYPLLRKACIMYWSFVRCRGSVGAS